MGLQMHTLTMDSHGPSLAVQMHAWHDDCETSGTYSSVHYYG